jgi:hypothetical protein
LIEKFDQLKMSSEIRSSDHFPNNWEEKNVERTNVCTCD